MHDRQRLTAHQLVVFQRRSESIFRDCQRRALRAGRRLDYDLELLRYFVRHNLGERHCHYCRGPVRVDTFALDHKDPTSRNGSFAFHNLAVVCDLCAAAKGDLDYIEFKELSHLLATWAPWVRKYFLSRLKNGRADEPLVVPRFEEVEAAEADLLLSACL